MLYETRSQEDTACLAERLSRDAQKGDVYCLTGPMGAGKTAFAAGFAKGLGYQGYTSSPTFTLMNVYEGGRLTLYHFDLYRLSDINGGCDGLNREDNPDAYGLADIGFEDYLYGDGLCLIEWADRAAALMPDTAIWVSLSADDDRNTDYRRVEIKTVSERNDRRAE